ncbi:hypothetical protein A3Q56_02729 [Intoshia linei]|uniref:Speriolin C-terminal domain-containing protein n=1 Tax=Intoshia linei TaxID=1819745 RepID=A0A177B5F0_9BILA|nr:hypothetical protein A3Q56_02729 [Intoshia linei]
MQDENIKTIEADMSSTFLNDISLVDAPKFVKKLRRDITDFESQAGNYLKANLFKYINVYTKIENQEFTEYADIEKDKYKICAEISFQFERECIKYIFKEKMWQHENCVISKCDVYKNIAICRKINSHLTNKNIKTLDFIVDSDISGIYKKRYAHLMHKFKSYGYLKKRHATFTVDLINQYGILSIKRLNRWSNFSPVKLLNVLLKILPEKYMEDVMLIFTCLKALKKTQKTMKMFGI